jgi:tetratricopeptide (TPR) repeat protein
VDARDGFQLWSKRFDRPLRDVFAIQEEIAEAVAKAVRGEVAVPPARRVLASRPPADFHAYELYLRGRDLVSRRGDRAAMRGAVALFEEAIAADPHYAPAHAGLGEARFALWQYPDLFARDHELSLDRALETARTAVSLDPDLAYAHAVLGNVLFLRADWPGASAAFERALELDPGSVRARHWWSYMLLAHGDRGGALREAELSLRLDPLSGVLNYHLGQVLAMTGRLEEAIPRLLRSLELKHDSPTARNILSSVYIRMGRERAAADVVSALAPAVLRPLFRVAMRLFGFEFGVRLYYRLAAWRSGEACLPDPGAGAIMLAYLGEREEMLRCLDEAIDSGRFYLVKVDPTFDPYRDDPRFQALLARVGLAD